MDKIQIILISFGLIFVLNCLRGGAKMDSLIGIPPCGSIYWGFNFMMMVVGYCLTKFVIAR